MPSDLIDLEPGRRNPPQAWGCLSRYNFAYFRRYSWLTNNRLFPRRPFASVSCRIAFVLPCDTQYHLAFQLFLELLLLVLGFFLRDCGRQAPRANQLLYGLAVQDKPLQENPIAAIARSAVRVNRSLIGLLFACLILSASSGESTAIADLALPNWNYTGGVIHYKNSNYHFDIRGITSFSGGIVTLNQSSTYPLTSGYGYFIDDICDALDTEGE